VCCRNVASDIWGKEFWGHFLHNIFWGEELTLLCIRCNDICEKLCVRFFEAANFGAYPQAPPVATCPACVELVLMVNITCHRWWRSVLLQYRYFERWRCRHTTCWRLPRPQQNRREPPEYFYTHQHTMNTRLSNERRIRNVNQIGLTPAFSVAGPVCWNSLPDYLKSSDLSFNCFRQQLKTFLFCKYWHQSQHYFSALETLLMRSTNAWHLLTYLLTYLTVTIMKKSHCLTTLCPRKSYPSKEQLILTRWSCLNFNLIYLYISSILCFLFLHATVAGESKIIVFTNYQKRRSKQWSIIHIESSFHYFISYRSHHKMVKI